LQMNVWVCR